jgi:hypothetical protein
MTLSINIVRLRGITTITTITTSSMDNLNAFSGVRQKLNVIPGESDQDRRNRLARERRVNAKAKQTETLIREVTKIEDAQYQEETTTTTPAETPKERRNRLARERRQQNKILREKEEAKARAKAIENAPKIALALSRPLSSIKDEHERFFARLEYKELGIYDVDTDPDKEKILQKEQDRVDKRVKTYMTKHVRWYEHIKSRLAVDTGSDEQKRWFAEYSQVLSKSKITNPKHPLYRQDPLYLFAKAEADADEPYDKVNASSGHSMLMKRGYTMMF